MARRIQGLLSSPTTFSKPSLEGISIGLTDTDQGLAEHIFLLIERDADVAAVWHVAVTLEANLW